MKLDFAFDSLTEDKSAKTMELTHAMHMVASTDADLNFKIASVKKVRYPLIQIFRRGRIASRRFLQR